MPFNNPLPGVPDIESPFFEKVFAAKGLPDETMAVARQLHERGYAVIDFPDPDFEARAERIKAKLGEGFDFEHWKTVLHPAHDGLRVQDAWRDDPDVRAIAANPQLLALLEALYGRRPFPFQTLNFPTGTQQAVHSDVVHFSSSPPGFMCGVWVALEDIDGENGPLVYYPGSHKQAVFSNDQLGVCSAREPHPSAHYGRYVELWAELMETLGIQPQTFHAKKGQALIWAANLLHGGSPHRSLERTRWSQVTHYFFDDCAYYTPLHSDPFYGAIDFRRLEDIGTGEAKPNAVGGHMIPEDIVTNRRARLHPRFVSMRRRLNRLTGGLFPAPPEG